MEDESSGKKYIGNIDWMKRLSVKEAKNKWDDGRCNVMHANLVPYLKNEWMAGRSE